tara:strand:- start:329 stop:580 length:252 start_codon:yes stop_codon:yes gene_type:complete
MIKKTVGANERTIKINGIQLDFVSANNLIELIDDKIKSIKVKTKNIFDKDLIKKNKLSNTKKHLNKFLSQWKNIRLGDNVKYK